MKNLFALTAIAMVLASSTGCGVCRNLFGGRPHTVALPVQTPAAYQPTYTQPCAPACVPCCPPPCDPCCGPGF